MAEIKEYHSSFTGQEVDALLTKVKDGSITAGIEKELADKADKSGYYPQMSVGQADNLPGRGDVTEGFIGFRESAGAGNSIEDGTANVVELLGESLVWNQWAKSFEEAYEKPSHKDITITYNGNKVTIDNWRAYNAFRFDIKCSTAKDHLYLVLLNYANTNPDQLIYIEFGGENFFPQNIGNIACFHRNIIYNNAYKDAFTLYLAETLEGTVTLSDLQVIDLTKMFGAGNEPTTIDEFYARVNQLVGVDFNAYNEGEVLGVNIKGIKSVNDNAWDEEWENGTFNTTTGDNNDYGDVLRQIRSKNPIKILPNAEYYSNREMWVIFEDSDHNIVQTPQYGGTTSGNSICIISGGQVFVTPINASFMRFYMLSDYGSTYNHDICIRLAHSGYKTDYVAHEEAESSFDLTKYFPNGMHGLNGVRDSATPKKTVRRFEVVDMGDLNWYPDASLGGFYSDTLVGAKKLFDGICAKYPFVGDYRNVTDKTCGFVYELCVLVKDSSYTDAASFKEAMKGVPLIYELATPIETEIDPQLNMNYKVWDFGTEELLTDSKSAPVLARTIYGFNATDTIRGNKAMNENQEARIHALESEVVRKGDYSPDNSVGFADDLVGRGESVPAEFSFRASGGKSIKDGAARIKRLKGNSVVWNNMVDTRGYEGQLFITTGIRIVKGHKYLLYRTETNQGLYLIPTVNGADNYDMVIREGQHSGIFQAQYSDDKGQGTVYSESYCGACVISDLTKMFGADNEPTTIEEFYARKPIVEDEYAYNEGEVIHMTAEGIKSVGDNAWDEEYILVGTHLESANAIPVLPNAVYYFNGNFNNGVFWYDNSMQLIKTEFAQNTNKTSPSNAAYMRFALSSNYGTTYNNDIMITLVHSGWKQDTDAGYQPYWEDRLIFDQRIKDEFPNGMQKWDMVYNKDGKGYIVKGTGVVDLGTLNWELSEFNGHSAFFSERNQLGAKYADGIFYLCAKYQSAKYRIFTEGLDKSIALNNGYYGNVAIKDFIIIRDTSYTDAATFKAAMAGVLLYYELAEPTIIEYDEPFNLDYRVADFGTEQAIAEQPSAPISADIIYQFNAVDMIREHEIEINELQSIIATMQAQLASLTSNNG